MQDMTTWQKSSTRHAPKTKAELREMLAEAIRNTQLPKVEAPKPPVREIPAEAPRID